MELSGPWVATEADDDIRRFGLGADTDDQPGTRWRPITVPGHWQHNATFADSTGPLMYRHRFNAAPPAEGRRRFITFDGVFYQADAWLDGAYLGDPEGYFFPHTYDITALSRIADEHVLAVEVACATQDPRARTNIDGILQAWRGLPAGWNPGGLWRSVRLFDTGPVHLDRLRVICRDADERRAHLRIAARLHAAAHHDVTLRTLRDGEVIAEQVQPVAVGDNVVEWTLDVRSPKLWWPRGMGDQPLTTIEVEVLVDGVRSDGRQRRVGMRQVDWNDWVCSVNGERVFLRGVNLMPITVGLADTGTAAIERDLDHIVELGLNAVRVHGHISRRRLYHRADELGLLVLQDFPLERTQSRSVRSQAVEQATACVDALGHHPSIISWTAHNEPSDVDATGSGWRATARRIAAQQLPSWNKSVLDRWVKRAFERADGSRRTVAHSGAVPHIAQLDATDRHLWFGWRYGDPSDLARRARLMPSMVRFVSEFGADSIPDDAPELDAIRSSPRWPDVDFDGLIADDILSEDLVTAVPPGDFASFDAWRVATQRYQADLLKVQIETLRRLKYRPTGGFCFSFLADPAPSVSGSVLDHRRAPKLAYDVVRDACAPIIVVADPPPPWVSVRDRLRLDLHLVNDTRAAIDAATVAVTATWPGGNRRWNFGGPVEADEVVKVGSIVIDVPDMLGELAIELTGTADGAELPFNRYTTAITLPPE